MLILGIGVAGLQAIGTARRLGAVVKAYDVRPETREQAESLGAQFVKLKTTIDATGAGGYARELTAEERAAQQAELNEVIGGMDVVITTAQVPGPQAAGARHRRRGRQDEAGLGDRRHGRVARSAATASCRKAGETVETPNGVTIIAPDNLPASMPAGASAFYARNISALLLGMVKDGALQPRLRGRGHQGDRHHPRRRGRVRGRQEAARAGPGGRPPEARHEPEETA